MTERKRVMSGEKRRKNKMRTGDMKNKNRRIWKNKVHEKEGKRMKILKYSELKEM